MSLLIRWGPAIAWMLVIFTFSANSDPFQVIPESITVPDEIIGRAAHVIEYAILAILVCRAILEDHKMKIASAAKIFIISATYGLFDEVHQSLIPQRAFQVLDLGLDIFGILIGLSFVVLIRTRV